MTTAQPVAASAGERDALASVGGFLSAMLADVDGDWASAQESVVSSEVLLDMAPVSTGPDAAALESLPAMQWTAAAASLNTPHTAPVHVQAQWATLATASQGGAERVALPLETSASQQGRGPVHGALMEGVLQEHGLSLEAEVLSAAAGRGLVAERSGATSLQAPALAASVPMDKGAQPLMEALAQRIQVQQAQGVQVATVRLDPPQMGSLEIRIRQDAAGVQVHMQASHAEVGRQLTTLLEGLRQELQSRHADAAVTVAAGRFAQTAHQGDGSRQGRQEPHQDPEQIVGQALQWDAVATS